MSLSSFISGLPKTELHLHIEGSFEPELMFKIAQRNKVEIPFASVEEIRAAYEFNNLQEFLDIYYAGANVLLEEQDFYDLTWAYLEKVSSQNVRHVEIFFDPQTHTDRGVAFDKVIKGIKRALDDAETKLGISHHLILSFLRHLDEESAFKTLEQGLEYKDWLLGVGLDSSELGNPPSKFKNAFAKVREAGLKVFAHAGEEGPAEYIWEALELLKVDRIDHGNRSMEDEKLVQELVDRRMALTLCPLSNKALQVCPDLRKHPLREMMEKDLLVTINSDDPAYFGGYMNENYQAVADALELSKKELAQLSINGFEASYLEEEAKAKGIQEVQEYLKANS